MKLTLLECLRRTAFRLVLYLRYFPKASTCNANSAVMYTISFYGHPWGEPFYLLVLAEVMYSNDDGPSANHEVSVDNRPTDDCDRDSTGSARTNVAIGTMHGCQSRRDSPLLNAV